MINVKLHGLNTVMLCFSLAILITSIATSSWGCGRLFDQCQQSLGRDVSIGITFALILGCVCLLVVIFMDLVGYCVGSLTYSWNYVILRLCLLFLGTGILVTGLFIFTARYGKIWSFLGAVIGATFVVQITLMNMEALRCRTRPIPLEMTQREVVAS